MSFNENKTRQVFCGVTSSLHLNSSQIQSTGVHKDLGVYISDNLSWNYHISTKLKKAQGVFYFVERNTSPTLSRSTKLYLYRSLIIPTFAYASPCWHASRQSCRDLEGLHQRASFWLLPQSNYKERLKLPGLLPLPLYL